VWRAVGDNSVTLRVRHRRAGKVCGGVDGGGVQNLWFSPVACCVFFQ
jgi:hypothetical protein